ncbi:MAG: methyl-accepting chemotaxis protein [Planctomycetaceae bacterium]|nr:methyl-accepting chemotaxis protein [Planctomycetaceae bacterium]
MKLFPRIFGIGLVGLLIAGIITAISIYYGSLSNNIRNEENKYRSFQAELIAAKNAHLLWLRNIDDAIISAKPEVKTTTDGKLCAFGKWYYSDGMKVVKTLPAEFQTAFKNIEPDHLKVHRLGGDLLKVWNKDDLIPAVELFTGQIVPTATTLIGHLSNLETLSRDKVDDIQKQGAWLLHNQNVPTLVTLIIGVLILLPYTWFTARGIVKPLQLGGAIFRSISEQGCLDKNMPESILRRKDEIGDLGRGVELILKDYRSIAGITEQLAAGDWQISVCEKSPDDVLNQNFSRMLDQMNRVLHEVGENIKHVTTGASEVSSAAQRLAGGTQESAANLEQITASMTEISTQTQANAQSAGSARDYAQKVTRAVSDGQTAMQAMNAAMEQITKNASEIQRVIKVIDDIAFQTNLLALNAAVEAARAGQHGKGFAVVAEEVRNLAARSAKAAKETANLIATSGNEIAKGGEVATHTSEVLDEIVTQIKGMTDLISGIAVASNEQAQGVNQVTIGLQQIDSVTQQNSANAEQSASAANEMSDVASKLQQQIAGFKLR